MPDRNDPELLGGTILDYKQRNNCTILEAADAVYADMYSRGYSLSGRPPRVPRETLVKAGNTGSRGVPAGGGSPADRAAHEGADAWNAWPGQDA